MATDGPPVCECGYLAVGRCVDCSTWVCADHGRRVEDRLRCDTDAEALEAVRVEEAEKEKVAARRREQQRILREAGWDEDDVASWGDGLADALAWAAAGFNPREAEAWDGEGMKAPVAAAFRDAWIELEDAYDWHRKGFTPADATAWAARGCDAHDAAKWMTLGHPTPDAAAAAYDAGCHSCRTRTPVWELEQVEGELMCSGCVGDCDCCGLRALLEHLGDVEHPYRPEVRPEVDVCASCSLLLKQGTRSAWDSLFEYDADFEIEEDPLADDFDLLATAPLDDRW